MEKWSDIPWFEGKWQVTKSWRFRNINYNNTWKIVEKQFKKSWKYRNSMCWTIHSLILLTFVWPRPKWYDINHKNWDKYDNRLENLEYCTKSYNAQHSYRVLNNKPNINCKWMFWKLNYNHKRVSQLDLDWNLIENWDCISEVKRKLWIWIANISNVCNWKRNTAWWYKWKFI